MTVFAHEGMMCSCQSSWSSAFCRRCSIFPLLRPYSYPSCKKKGNVSHCEYDDGFPRRGFDPMAFYVCVGGGLPARRQGWVENPKVENWWSHSVFRQWIDWTSSLKSLMLCQNHPLERMQLSSKITKDTEHSFAKISSMLHKTLSLTKSQVISGHSNAKIFSHYKGSYLQSPASYPVWSVDTHAV